MTGAKRTSGRNNGKGNGTGTANAAGSIACSGADAGNYTTNCPASWIKNFDPSQPWARDEEMAIEWLRPPKPSRGWPVYDGFVYDVSRNEDILKIKLKELLKAEAEKAEKADHSDDEKAEDEGSESALAENPVVKALIEKAVQSAKKETASMPAKSSSTAEPIKMIDLGKGLLISEHVHQAAMAAKSPSTMICTLLPAAYSRQYLLDKSYAGQSKTIAGTKQQKKGLKKKTKMIAIRNAVLKKWPVTSGSVISAAVNNFIGRLRNLDKKGELDTLDEEMEESDSDN